MYRMVPFPVTLTDLAKYSNDTKHRAACLCRDGVLEDCPQARGPKIVALASNSSGLGLGLSVV